MPHWTCSSWPRAWAWRSVPGIWWQVTSTPGIAPSVSSRDRPVRVDDRLAPVEREAQPPRRVRGVDEGLGVHADADPAAHDGVVADDPLEHERAQRIDHRLERLLALPGRAACGVDLRAGHDPDAHLGDDPEVALHEQAVERRAVGVLVDVPGLVAGLPAHAGAQHLAVGKHDLHAADVRGVVAVRGVAAPVLQGVADDAAPAQVGDRRPAVPAGGLEGVVQVEPAHAGLDHGVAELLVDLEDLVHLAHVHDDRAAHAGCGAAVGVVAALSDGPQRDAVLVGDPHDRLDLLGGRGGDGCGGVPLVGLLVGVRIAELAQRLGVGHHRIGAEHVDEGLDRLLDIALRNPGRQDSGHGSPPDLVDFPSDDPTFSRSSRRGAGGDRERPARSPCGATRRRGSDRR